LPPISFGGVVDMLAVELPLGCACALAVPKNNAPRIAVIAIRMIGVLMILRPERQNTTAAPAVTTEAHS